MRLIGDVRSLVNDDFSTLDLGPRLILEREIVPLRGDKVFLWLEIVHPLVEKF